jgi:integrase
LRRTSTPSSATCLSEIDTALVTKVLEPIWTTTSVTAHRVRGRIELVLDWAKAHGYRDGENPARWRGHLDKLLAKRPKHERRVVHHPAIPYRDVPAFMVELRGEDTIAAHALEFTILTASRIGEVTGARWSEVDGNNIWTVPANRMKTGVEHCVPLSSQAVALLKSLPRTGELIFPGKRSGAGLSNKTPIKLLHRIRMGHADATVHGFRSSFRDWASEQTGFPREVCEAALAHAVGDAVEAAYRRGDLIDKRRLLMQAWSDYCRRPVPTAATVTPIGVRHG